MITNSLAILHFKHVRGKIPYIIMRILFNTECPTPYRNRHFFNNFTTNEDIATKFEADLPHCVRNVTTTNVLLFKFRCNISIGVRIIKEMPGSVASGTLCILPINATDKVEFFGIQYP